MSSKTLLFADDSATMRLIMEKTFQGENFNIVTVPSGQAAIEKAKELAPDVIIADAGMSGVSGYDVCDAIRNDAVLAVTPVVIMSGISNPYEESRGKSVGATEHIKKPFDTTKLIDRVTELCAEAVRPSVTGVPSAAGVAPARPIPGVAPIRKETPADMSGTGSTLHAFPRPSLTDESVRPVQPVAARMPAIAADTQPNMSTGIAAASVPPSHKEPEPIEIAEEETGSEIQVGTLAELAQMNAHGGQVQQEVRDDAIELDGAHAPSPAPEPQPEKPVRPSRSVAEAASQAAKEIATKVEGLTSAQAQAIMALTEDVVERVVWEVVPDLAEAIIREKLDELLKK